MKNKQKIHNYAIMNFKYIAKKTTGQWTDISVQGDQEVKNLENVNAHWQWSKEINGEIMKDIMNKNENSVCVAKFTKQCDIVKFICHIILKKKHAVEEWLNMIYLKTHTNKKAFSTKGILLKYLWQYRCLYLTYTSIYVLHFLEGAAPCTFF